MLEGKGLIIHMILAMYSITAGCIKMATGKWRSIYFRQDVRKIIFFQFSPHKTSNTFQLLCISDLFDLGVDEINYGELGLSSLV